MKFEFPPSEGPAGSEAIVADGGYAAWSHSERWGRAPHVEDWRGYGGDSSDTAMFQAAAALAPAGIVRMQGTTPAVSYDLEDTITVARSHVLFDGGGQAGLGHSTGSQEYTVNFNWTGAAGGTMWLFSPVAGPSNQNRHGGGLVSCRLLGNTVAAIGLQVISWCRGRFDIWGHNLTDWVMDMDVIPAGNLGDITAASFNDVWVHARQSGANTGGILRVGGDDDGNVCYNFFWTVQGTVSNGAIADIGNTDSNWFHLLRGNQVGGYATAGIILRGAHNALNACRGNFFNMVYPTSTANSMRSCGTDTFTDPVSGDSTTYAFPAKGNQILWYDKGNAAPDPIIGTGSTLVWGDHTGAHSYASLLENPGAPAVLPGTTAVYANGGNDLRVKFDSGADRSLVSGQIIGASAVAVSHTGDTAATALATVTLPGGSVGANGFIVIGSLWSHTNSANAKTLTVKLGSTTVFGVVPTVSAIYQHRLIIRARNSQSSQVSAPSNYDGAGTSTSVVIATSKDLTANIDITFNGTLASAGETITLEAYSVEVFYRP